MEKFAAEAIAMMPDLEKNAAMTDAMLDKTAADAKLSTERAIERMLRLVERKRALCALAEVCRRMTSVMTERELRIIRGRTAGQTEESLAAETGVCRSTVHSCHARALEKCVWVLGAMKRAGYDFSVFASLGLRFPSNV